MSVKAHLLTGREPLATGEIPFIGFAFALVRISETASPRPVGCQAKMAVSEDKSRMTGRRAGGHLPIVALWVIGILAFRFGWIGNLLVQVGLFFALTVWNIMRRERK